MARFRRRRLPRPIYLLIKLRSQLELQGASAEEIYDTLSRVACRPRNVRVNGVERDATVLAEARRRRLSCAAWCEDDELLKEAHRRALSLVVSDIEPEEFAKVAQDRGYRRSLDEFPRNEIECYLRVQVS